MKPARFDYHVASTLEEALALLAEHGPDAKPLAGGQSLIPAMNFRLATPSVLVDLNRIDALSYIRQDEGALVIGGMTRQRIVERSMLIEAVAPLVTAAMPYVAHAAIRSRGTVGGSLAHADPAAELPAVMLALDASMTLQNRARTRVVRASDFFTGLFSTALEPAELLVGISIPPQPSRSGFGFEELSRRHGDFALAGVAACVATSESGVCTTARVGLFSLADRPLLSDHVASALVGQRPTPEAIRAAAEDAARDDIDPTSDMHASSGYRRHLAAVLIRRALERAFHSLEQP